jgi:anti-anti-sigma factor
VRSEQSLDTALIRLYGEFDRNCEEAFGEELERVLTDERRLILDLRGLRYMDSTGLRMLILVDNQSMRDGFELIVLCGDRGIRQLLRETGLDGVIPVVDSHAGMVPASDSPVY